MFPSPFVKTGSFPYQDSMEIKEATGWYSFIISKICWLLMSVRWLVGSVSSPTAPPSTWVGEASLPVIHHSLQLHPHSWWGFRWLTVLITQKRPVINHNEDLIKIPLLFSPIWFIIKEKIWVKCFINILWFFYLQHSGACSQGSDAMLCFNVGSLMEKNLEQHLVDM